MSSAITDEGRGRSDLRARRRHRARAVTRPGGRWPDRLLAGYVLLLLVAGGAGIRYPAVTLVVQWASLVVAAAYLPLLRWSSAAAPLRLLLVAAVGVCLLGALQSVPLPPAWWRGLPGRETAAAVFDSMGWSDRWHAASLKPDETLASLLVLLPALAGLLATAALPADRRVHLLRLIVAGAIVATMLAAVQVGTGEADAPVPWRTAQRGDGTGFFVNRNHQAVFLLVAVMLAAVPGVVRLGGEASRRIAPRERAVALGIVAFLVLGVLATKSRTALLLLPPVLLLALALVTGWRRSGRFAVGAALAYGALGAALSQTELVARVATRFGTNGEELRLLYWANSWFALRSAWPVGTGLGTFVTVYQGVEPLGEVGSLLVNHAHNDLLEFVLEGGLAGAMLLVAVMAGAVWSVVAGWRATRASERRAQVAAAAGGLLVILAFSVIDYPLRMAAIGALAGALLGMALPPGMLIAATDRSHRRIVMAAALPVALLVAATHGSALFAAGGSDAATRVAPWSAAAWVGRSERALLTSRPADAADAGARAVAIAPTDARAVRAAGLAELAAGRLERGGALMGQAAALGWRDTPTQLWLIAQARSSGQPALAAERSDALLRRDTLKSLAMRELRAVYAAPGGVAALADRLAVRPSWRQGFFNSVAPDVPGDVPRFLDLLARLRAGGAPADAAETMSPRWHLGGAGAGDAVRAVWQASGERAVIGDGAFRRTPDVLAERAAPYEWYVPTLAGVRVTTADVGGLVAGGGGRAVTVHSDGLAGGAVLAQTVALPAGTYRLAVLARPRAGDVDGQLGVALGCAGEVATPVPWQAAEPVAGGWRRYRASVTVPPSCSLQTLALLLAPVDGTPGKLTIGGVTLAP